MSEVRIFHSHIEVYPYEKGECPTIEKMLSKYIKMNNGYGKYEPMAYYIENNKEFSPLTAISAKHPFFKSTTSLSILNTPCLISEKFI